MAIHYLTPDRRMLLRDDGILVAAAEGIEAREPEEAELGPVLLAAAGHGVDALANLSTMGPPDMVRVARAEGTLTNRVKQVYEKMPVFHDYFEFVFAVLDLVGFNTGDDPLLRQAQAIDNILHDYFKRVDHAIYGAWSATRLAMLADVQAHASAARETLRSIFANHDNLSDGLTVARLAQADHSSLLAVNTFTNGVDGGYWRRPHSDLAVTQEFWANKFEDRAPIYGDNTVWDPRLAIPTLLYAITIRMMVLVAIHGDPARFCHEINSIVQFLLSVQMRWQEGIRRKLRLTPSEHDLWGGFTTVPFYAGAIDVFTGRYHMILIDYEAWNLSYALGLTAEPMRPGLQPTEFLNPADVAPTITQMDIGMRFPQAYHPILDKQADLSFTKLRWLTGLHEFSDTIKALGEVCNPPPRRRIVVTYRNAIKKAKMLTPMPGIDPETDRRAHLAGSLTDLMNDPKERSTSNAMADRFLLLSALDESKGTLVSELKELLRKHGAERRRSTS